MLNEMRLGHISEQTVETFKKMSRPIHFNDGLEVTELSVTLSPSPHSSTNSSTSKPNADNNSGSQRGKRLRIPIRGG